MCASLLAACSFGLALSSPSVRLVSNLPSPQPVGTVIGLTALARYAGRPTVVFRYSVSVDGGEFRMVRDFSQDKSFAWRPELFEHEARVRVTIRNNESRKTEEAELPFRITSRITGSQQVVSPTAHPLVALFSAPPCPEGSQFRVAFQKEGDAPHRTPSEACRGSRSNNIYVAQMRADTLYQMHGEVTTGDQVQPGAPTVFHTGIPDGKFPPRTVVTARNARSSSAEPVLITTLTDPMHLMASDLEGNLIWYLPEPSEYQVDVLAGGRFLIDAPGANSVNDMKRVQLLKELDLVGNTIRETNVSRVAEQLESHGIKSDCKKGGQQCLSGFHHDAIRLPNGHTLVIAGFERMFPAGTQGSKEPVDVLGDMVLDLDPDFQLAWFWNAFDHMDLKRLPRRVMNTCKQGPGSGGCPPVFLAAAANGWLHSNSLNYDPRDGNVLLSIPEQDWVVKIDYQNGKGSGRILWRLGLDGDFTAKSDVPDPWFSFQHDAGFDPPGSDMISLFDDGHRRREKSPQANNRGQVWRLDEKAHIATLVMNTDLGVYSVGPGSAERLQNGNYHFDAGLVDPGPAPFGRAIEVSPEGKIVYSLQVDGAITYRSYRLVDLYTPTVK